MDIVDVVLRSIHGQKMATEWTSINVLDVKHRLCGDHAMDENLNMSIRRFLKKVGITSQNEIEKAWKDNKSVKVKMVLTIEELGLEHSIEGEIGKDWIKLLRIIHKTKFSDNGRSLDIARPFVAAQDKVFSVQI